MSAGDWPSSVPDRLVCEGRFGIAPGEECRRRQDRVRADRVGRRPSKPTPRRSIHRPSNGGAVSSCRPQTDERALIVSTTADAISDVTTPASSTRSHDLRRGHAATGQPGRRTNGALRARQRAARSSSQRIRPNRRPDDHRPSSRTHGDALLSAVSLQISDE